MSSNGQHTRYIMKLSLTPMTVINKLSPSQFSYGNVRTLLAKEDKQSMINALPALPEIGFTLNICIKDKDKGEFNAPEDTSDKLLDESLDYSSDESSKDFLLKNLGDPNRNHSRLTNRPATPRKRKHPKYHPRATTGVTFHPCDRATAVTITTRNIKGFSKAPRDSIRLYVALQKGNVYAVQLHSQYFSPEPPADERDQTEYHFYSFNLKDEIPEGKTKDDIMYVAAKWGRHDEQQRDALFSIHREVSGKQEVCTCVQPMYAYVQCQVLNADA